MSDDKSVRPDGVVGKTRKLAARGIRLAQLGGARVAATAAEAMRRKARELEIRLDGLHKGLDIKPVSDVAFPKVDLAASQGSGCADHGGAGDSRRPRPILTTIRSPPAR